MADALSMSLTTPLGSGRMRFLSMVAIEEVGKLFEFRVFAEDDDPAVPATALLGKPASMALQLPVPGTRPFHGIVCSMSLEGVGVARTTYGLVLRPWLWLLTRRADTRVFQHKGIKEILKLVFEPFSADFEFRLSGQYPVYDYCVQYRETDFAFVSRLMEREGVNYYFKHARDKHTLVLVDAPNAHPAGPAQDVFPYRETRRPEMDFDSINRWRVDHEIQSGAVALDGYDFEQPRTSLRASYKATRPGASDKLEVYDFPGLYRTAAEGLRYATVRLEERQAAYLRCRGTTGARTLCAGHTFMLDHHPRPDQNARHLILSTRIEMSIGGATSGPAESSFDCTFEATLATEHYRPAALTPWPVVAGVHSAVVVGPAGEEIHTDAQGRIKVQFHWDRHGKSDADSSCWVRVAQPSAGGGWGMLALPRIGQEVIVGFMDGDPDHPVVVGRVYNGTHKPPYALPDNKTVTTMKSRSSKGGGAYDFNELRFEDKRGSEYVRLQAQSNYYQAVKKDAAYVVGKDQSVIVKQDRRDKTERDSSLMVGRHRLERVESNDSLSVGENYAVKVGSNFGLAVTGAAALSAGQSTSIDARASVHVKAGANLGMAGGANVHIKGGASVVIEAGAMLTLKAGGATVMLGPMGVSITGTLVRINSGGGGGSGSGANPESPRSPQQPQPPQEQADPLPSS